MIHLKKNKLIIELDEPYPKEALKELQISIINVLQAQFLNKSGGEDENLTFSNYRLLELLKELIKPNT